MRRVAVFVRVATAACSMTIAIGLAQTAAAQTAGSQEDCRKTGSCAGGTKPGGVENAPSMQGDGGSRSRSMAPRAAPPPPAPTTAAPATGTPTTRAGRPTDSTDTSKSQK